MLVLNCTGTASDEPDSGSIDSGSIDSGSIDSGSIDSGSIDSGSIDSGSIDSGSIDSGTTDSGTTDAGDGTCVPGAAAACACPGGMVGMLRCAADGVPFDTGCECVASSQTFAVSPLGADLNPGTLASPFQSFERAQRAVREARDAGATGEIRVWVRGGVYELSRGLVFDASLSGSDAGVVVWSGYPGERATLVGGRRLQRTSFVPMQPTSPLFTRLDPTARAAVLTTSLSGLGIDAGALLERGAGCGQPELSALELLVNGVPEQLARWPDADEHTQQSLDANTNQLEVFGEGLTPDVRGTFVRTGTADGVSQFERTGLVGGLQYSLYRINFQPFAVPFVAWYMTTNTSGYPSANPFWYLHQPELDTMAPYSGAAGMVSFKSLSAIERGFAMVAGEESPTRFHYAGTRPSRWTQATDVWVHGLLKYEWGACHQRVASIDQSTQSIVLQRPPPYGIGVEHHWYAENLLEEITRPGEWWLDRATMELVVWPSPAFADGPITVTTLDEPLLTIAGARHLTIENLSLEGGRSRQVSVASGNTIRLRGLRLLGAGANAVVLEGTEVTLEHALISHSGNAGVIVRGGHRPSLTPGRNAVSDSVIRESGRWEWTYRPAIALEGVGNQAIHNRLVGNPHSAMLFAGNDHLIAHNDISEACRMARDSGAIYSGRDWSYRGITIRGNAIHDIKSALGFDVHGVYLDDCISGTTVTQNIFERVDGYGIHHRGGMHTTLTSNVFAQSRYGMRADRDCWVTVNDLPGDDFNLLAKLRALNYQQPPWSTRYSELAAVPSDYLEMRDAGWLDPVGARFSSNVGDGTGEFTRLPDRFVLPAYAEVAHNRPDAGPLFEDAGYYLLRPTASTTGFVGFPTSELGVRHH